MRDDVVITPYRDGPLLVRGPVRLADQDGNEITLDRETIGALPLRQVAHAAVLRRHAQARPVPRSERRRGAQGRRLLVVGGASERQLPAG